MQVHVSKNFQKIRLTIQVIIIWLQFRSLWWLLCRATIEEPPGLCSNLRKDAAKTFEVDMVQGLRFMGLGSGFRATWMLTQNEDDVIHLPEQQRPTLQSALD